MTTKEFALRLRTQMKRRGITQAQLARRAGLTQCAVSRLCNGMRMPHVETARRLKRALGCEWQDLLGL